MTDPNEGHYLRIIFVIDPNEEAVTTSLTRTKRLIIFVHEGAGSCAGSGAGTGGSTGRGAGRTASGTRSTAKAR